MKAVRKYARRHARLLWLPLIALAFFLVVSLSVATRAETGNDSAKPRPDNEKLYKRSAADSDEVDVDLDSDNDAGCGLPTRSGPEDSCEWGSSVPGKLVPVNDGDSDGDGIPDFADGFNWDTSKPSDDDSSAGDQFAMVVVQLPEGTDCSRASLTVTYSSAPPTAVTDGGTSPPTWGTGSGGHLRLWKSSGPRNMASVVDDTDGDGVADGSFIPSGVTFTSASDLYALGFHNGLPPNDPQCLTAVYYLEGVKASATAGDLSIEVTFDPDGTGTEEPPQTDEAKVTVCVVELDVDGDGVADDLAQYLQGYTGTNPAIDVSQQQDMQIIVRGAAAVSGLTFQLCATTDLPGYACNTTTSSPYGDGDPDFVLVRGGDGEQVVTNVATDASGVADVLLRCRDYGGSTVLSAQIAGLVLDTLDVPVDFDNDGLPDRWESEQRDSWQTQYGARPTPDTDDFFGETTNCEDTDPDGSGTDLKDHAAEGDRFTAFEEYRGYLGTYTADPTKHRRLSAARKELLIEVDIMGAQPGTPSGKMTGTTDAKEFPASPGQFTRSSVTDSDAGWTPGELVNMRINPDTSQDLQFVIMANTADTVEFYGRIEAATDLTTTTTYEITKWTPPTAAQVSQAMDLVVGTSGGSGFLGSAGVQIYYVIDDNGGTRAAWTLGAGAGAWHAGWMTACRDDGGVGEDYYADFLHLAFCDTDGGFKACPGVTDSSFGCMVLCFPNRAIVRNFESFGMSFEQVLASTAMHEIGHAVGCDDIGADDDESGVAKYENAFRVRNVSAGAGVAMHMVGALTCWDMGPRLYTGDGGPQDLSYDLRLAANDEMGELVAQISSEVEYDAWLDTDAAKPTAQLEWVDEALPVGVDVQLRCWAHDYIMFWGFSPDSSLRLEFSQEHPLAIPLMDVQNQHTGE